MRFSTRKSNSHKLAKAGLLAGVATLAVAGAVSYFTENTTYAEGPTTCKLKIQHIDRSTMQVIDGYTYEYTDNCSDQSSYTFSPESHITDTLGYYFLNARYEGDESVITYHAGDVSESIQTTIENRDIIESGDFAVRLKNDQSSKLVNLYYSRTPETCSIYVYHFKAGTNTPVDDYMSMNNNCNNIGFQVELSENALSNGYTFDSAKIENGSSIHTLREDDFPFSITNSTPIKTVYIYYNDATAPATPDTCSLVIHHYKKGTEEKVDDDITMSHYCGNIGAQVELSQKALAAGYTFDSAIMASERVINDDYTEDSFPIPTVNGYDKTYTIYYNAPANSGESENPNTSTGKSSLALMAASVAVALGAVFAVRVRRQ